MNTCRLVPRCCRPSQSSCSFRFAPGPSKALPSSDALTYPHIVYILEVILPLKLELRDPPCSRTFTGFRSYQGELLTSESLNPQSNASTALPWQIIAPPILSILPVYQGLVGDATPRPPAPGAPAASCPPAPAAAAAACPDRQQQRHGGCPQKKRRSKLKRNATHNSRLVDFGRLTFRWLGSGVEQNEL